MFYRQFTSLSNGLLLKDWYLIMCRVMCKIINILKLIWYTDRHSETYMELWNMFCKSAWWLLTIELIKYFTTFTLITFNVNKNCPSECSVIKAFKYRARTLQDLSVHALTGAELLKGFLDDLGINSY